MNDMRKKWIEALRSGSYEQGKGWLKAMRSFQYRSGLVAHGDDNAVYEYCCLGVACDLKVKEASDPSVKWNVKEDTRTQAVCSTGVPFNSTNMPSQWWEDFDLTNVVADDLMELNDSFDHSFSMIADLLEQGNDAVREARKNADEMYREAGL